MRPGINNDELKRRAELALANFATRKPVAPPWENRKVVIYGAGSFGRDLAKALLRQANVDILGFLDQKGAGQTVCHDLPAYNLESSMAKKWLTENPVVVIGVFNSSSSLQDIARQLTQSGCSSTITPMEAYLHLSKDLGWRFWMGTAKDYSGAAGVFEKARTLWADHESERLFLESLLFRMEFDLKKASSPTDVSYQYADPTLPMWREPIRLIDGGAYTGDTLQRLLSHDYQFAAIYAFEPDEENFKKLRLTASTLDPQVQIALWPCGVGSSTCKMRFSEGDGTSSKFSELGPSVVPVVALDDVLQGQSVNMIKLDIEGAELDALHGAQNLIGKYRPGLAVCLYHHPNHLWSIPLWVDDLKLGYRLYCRSYANSTFETVLYAIPN